MSFTANNTYGEYKHKLTIGEMPSHNHKVDIINYVNTASKNGHTSYWGGLGDTKFETSYSGSNTAHNNIQPSIGVYFWRRKA